MKAVVVHATGGPEVMHWEDIADLEPGPHEVVVDVAAVGLNYIDTYHRSGLYALPLPFVPGMEAAGEVVGVGSEVTRWTIGDRIAWSGVMGSYAERVCVPEDSAVSVPAAVTLEHAAAVMLQGMTAHYLAIDTFPLRAGQRCLIHAGAGGVGLLLIQIAKRIGAEVFATVGSAEKAALAVDAGADHVVLYRDVDFVEAIAAIAGPHSIDVVYDGVGQAVCEPSLAVLRRRGMMATFGNASGAVEPITPLRLMQGGSLYLTRPNLTDYIATRDELERRAADLFRWIGNGELRVTIGGRMPLSRAADAHAAIQSRGTTGKALLIPDARW
jgi:NADPH:quinone reductase